MTRLSLAVARLCSAMWVGAALLFVTTSVMEQVQPSFDPATKYTLALIRFPWYYGTGATLLGFALAAAWVAPLSPRASRMARWLLAAAVVLMTGDHVFIYRPMREALTPAGAGRGPGFERLHHWSEGVNAAGFLVSAAAAVILCAAQTPKGRSEAPANPAS